MTLYFLNFLNCQHENKVPDYAKQSSPFLDKLITKNDNSFKISTLQKITNSLFTNSSFILEIYKISLVKTLADCLLKINIFFLLNLDRSMKNLFKVL